MQFRITISDILFQNSSNCDIIEKTLLLRASALARLCDSTLDANGHFFMGRARKYGGID